MEQLVKQIESSLLNNFDVRVTGLIVLLLFFKVNFGQNLIQNGSFELNNNIDCATGNFVAVNNWLPIRSPDYFNSLCGFGSGHSTPINRFGIAYPINNNAYCGIAVYYKTSEYKEYIQQYLSNPLIAGKSYYVSFYVSRADRVGYAIKNIGVYLSVTQPAVISNSYIPATPQLENQTGFLTDTIGWTKIGGYFTAQGGEDYITIGNFNSIINTDTLYMGTNDPLSSDPGTAYYYIDSVSLYDSLDYVTNIRKYEEEFKVKVFPNPTSGMLNIECKILNDKTNLKIIITDVLGREIKDMDYEKKIDVSDLERGIYFLSIFKNDKLLSAQKILKK